MMYSIPQIVRKIYGVQFAGNTII